MRLRPKYRMELMKQTKESMFEEYSSYNNVETFIKQFQERVYETDNETNWHGWTDNFVIAYTSENKIDVSKTLANMKDNDLIRIAIDLGLPVPTVLPSFPTFNRLLTAEENGMSFAQDILRPNVNTKIEKS